MPAEQPPPGRPPDVTSNRSSLTVTSTAVASTLTGEMVIPSLQEGQAVFDHK